MLKNTFLFKHLFKNKILLVVFLSIPCTLPMFTVKCRPFVSFAFDYFILIKFRLLLSSFYFNSFLLSFRENKTNTPVVSASHRATETETLERICSHNDSLN